jgi:hypothetical protein
MNRRIITTGSRTITLLAVLSAVIGWQHAALGQAAFYIADAHATLTVLSPASVNEFGFATNINPQIDQDKHAFGNAFATWDRFNRPVPRGIESDSFALGDATGAPFNPAHADSFAKTSDLIRLGNLTGSGGPTPPATPLDIKMHLEWNYEVTAQADTVDDAALAHIMIGVDSPGLANPILIQDEAAVTPGPGFVSLTPNGFIDFIVRVPANTVLSVQLRTLAYGYADSVRPPDVLPPPPIPVQPFSTVPEPSTIAFLGTGAIGFARFACRRRKTQCACS